MVERLREHVDVVPRADVAYHDSGAALQPPQLRSLHRRAFQRRRELSGVISSSARASVRASLPASTARGAKGESVASARANFTFHEQTSLGDLAVYPF